MSVEPPPRPKAFGGPSPDDENASVGFAATALAHAALAAPLLLQPRAAAEYVLGATAVPTNLEQDHLLGLLAAGLLGSASAAWTLKGAADGHELETPTAERLQAGLMALAAAALAAHLQHNADLTNNGLGVGAAAAALTLGVPAARQLTTDRGRRRLGARAGGLLSAAGQLFTFRRGFKLSTALYAALTPVFVGAGVAYALRPEWSLKHVMGYVIKGRDSTFIWRNIGATLATVLPAMTYSLKEKADADQLAEPAARTMNLGLLATSAVHLAILGPVMADGAGGTYLPAVVGVWAAAAAAGIVGLSSSATEASF